LTTTLINRFAKKDCNHVSN